MNHNQFKTGKPFTCAGKTWLCTDIGRRTIAAICLDKEDASWYAGPPYAVAETVFDEYDMPACLPASGSTGKRSCRPARQRARTRSRLKVKTGRHCQWGKAVHVVRDET